MTVPETTISRHKHGCSQSNNQTHAEHNFSLTVGIFGPFIYGPEDC